MTDKITDAEVKKALECYRGQKMFAFNGKKPEIYIHDIIDLINSLEGVNEKNENIIRVADKTIATLQAENESLKAEVERLNNNISAMATTLSASARATRHEAYKVCLEKVKNYIDVGHLRKPTEICFSGLDVVEMLDNLLNELVGDGDGKRKD